MEAWASASIRLTRKGKEAEVPCLRGEHWSIGKDNPVRLSDLIYSFARTAAEFSYGANLLSSADEINAEIERTRALLAVLKYEPAQSPPTSGNGGKE